MIRHFAWLRSEGEWMENACLWGIPRTPKMWMLRWKVRARTSLHFQDLSRAQPSAKPLKTDCTSGSVIYKCPGNICAWPQWASFGSFWCSLGSCAALRAASRPCYRKLHLSAYPLTRTWWQQIKKSRLCRISQLLSVVRALQCTCALRHPSTFSVARLPP